MLNLTNILFPFLGKTTSVFKNWSILFRKKTLILEIEDESETIFKMQKKSSILKKTMKPIGHLNSMYLGLLPMRPFIYFFDWVIKPGMQTLI